MFCCHILSFYERADCHIFIDLTAVLVDQCVDWSWRVGADHVEGPRCPLLWLADVAVVMTVSTEPTSSRCQAGVPGTAIVRASVEFQTLPPFYMGFGVEGVSHRSWNSVAGKEGGSPAGVAGLMAGMPRSSPP